MGEDFAFGVRKEGGAPLLFTLNTAMTKALHNNVASFSHSAHWNKTAAPWADRRLRGAAFARTPKNFSAPHYDPKASHQVLSQPLSITEAVKLGVEAVGRLAKAVPLTGSGRASQVLREAALFETLPEGIKTAAEDAAEIAGFVQTFKHETLGTVRQLADQVKADPVGSLEQWGRAHAHAQRDAGYFIAQTADSIWRNPSQLLTEPASLAMAGIALGMTNVIPFKRGLDVVRAATDAAQTPPDLKIGYRSQPPVRRSVLTVPTNRGKLQLIVEPAAADKFNLTTMGDGERGMTRLAMTGRNVNAKNLEVTRLAHSPSVGVQDLRDDMVTALLWAQLGPNHGLEGQIVVSALEAQDRSIYKSRGDPRRSSMLGLLEGALAVLGIEVGEIKRSQRNWGASGGQAPVWILQTRRSEGGGTNVPRLAPDLPVGVSATSIAPVKGRALGQSSTESGVVTRFSAGGSILPVYSPGALDGRMTRHLSDKFRKYGADPLNPVDVFKVERHLAGGKILTHELPANRLAAGHLAVIEHAGLNVALTRRAPVTSRDAETMIGDAERYTGFRLMRSE